MMGPMYWLIPDAAGLDKRAGGRPEADPQERSGHHHEPVREEERSASRLP